MNCYDCHQTGDATPAIGVCHDCGAGICAEHTTESLITLTVITATNWQAPVVPPQRRIRCRTCAVANDAARELSSAGAVPPRG